ncbi:hypothetical protein O181_036426 [Austropuccinia psidii MF-1]|uniref:Uncharacterized protein n=1 Tax=Austropuccinia psidii MF-1 TaxID=1389203 RepID=A0A9Q3D4E4_9BASI|nr:hypothetical protein [Austropuccinia psidii MF-1]
MGGILDHQRFNLSNREPTIQHLLHHLEKKQLVYFQDKEGDINQVMTGSAECTTLTDFFRLNRRNAIGKGISARKLLYHELPQYFYWGKKKKQWFGRIKSRGTVGRLFFARISEGECYYLQLLLLHRKNMQSFQDLARVNGFLHPTFRGAAEAAGLLVSDKNYSSCITEASGFMTGSALRQMFAILLVHSPPSNPTSLLTEHLGSLSDDCKYKLQELNFARNRKLLLILIGT